jgi:hypothetical protein
MTEVKFPAASEQRHEMRDLALKMHMMPKRRTCASYIFADVKNVKKVLCEAEYRQLKDVRTRAAALVILGICSSHVAAKATGLQQPAVLRAVRAISDGRIPGTNGRPSALNNEAYAQLMAWMDEQLSREKHPAIRVIMEEVTYPRIPRNIHFPPLFFGAKHSLSQHHRWTRFSSTSTPRRSHHRRKPCAASSRRTPTLP